MLAPKDQQNASKEALSYLEASPETIRLNSAEDNPVNKKIFEIIPTRPIRISKISYALGGTDLSANGYISLVISRVENPNIYAVQQSNSQIIFEKMCGANGFIEGSDNFFENLVINSNEPLYVYLISNIPQGSKSIVRLVIYYQQLYF